MLWRPRSALLGGDQCHGRRSRGVGGDRDRGIARGRGVVDRLSRRPVSSHDVERVGSGVGQSGDIEPVATLRGRERRGDLGGRRGACLNL
uniref:Uncharacterized protein n=1 Tax=uncultured marine virus TaxID=186617 RepID=A0A0F7L8T3_9VIRU|nr:hypothetical protein [uncultured marine virus]